MKYYILLLSALLIIIASCKKVEEPKYKEDSLRQGKWRVAHVVKKTRLTDNTFYIDTLKRTPSDAECKADDYIEFKTANNGVLKTGEKKCQAEIDEIPIRWGITDNDTKVYVYQAAEMFFGNNDVSGNLKDFSDNQFIIDYMTTTYLNGTGGKIDTVWYVALVKKF